MGWWSADRRISVDSAIASAILTGAAKENTMSDEPTGSEPASREHMAPQGAPGPQQPPYSQYQPPAPASPPHRTQQPYGTSQYPDPAAPAAYPGATAPGAVPPQYPGYTGPSAYRQGPIAATGPGGMAIAALIVGIVAFLLCWIPFLGLVIAVVGIVLGILALRHPRGKAFGITAIVLSGLAALTGIVMLLAVFAWLPMAA